MAPRMNGSIRRLLTSVGGATAVELALTAPVVLLLLVGVFDFGMAILQKMRLNHAASVGANYALVEDRDETAVQAAIASSTNLNPADFQVSVDRVCECLDATVVSCSSSTACGTATRKRVFIELSVAG